MFKGPMPLTFLSFLKTISKTLNIANKILPIYKDIKPIAGKIPKLLDTIKNTPITNKTSIKNEEKKDNINNSPIFWV